jgi:hypothetical protein
MERQEGRITVRPIPEYDPNVIDPITEKWVHDDGIQLFAVTDVDGDVGDPYIEYSGRRRNYIRNLPRLNQREIDFLRQHGIEVIELPSEAVA